MFEVYPARAADHRQSAWKGCSGDESSVFHMFSSSVIATLADSQ
jgi:hypothetical protein